MALESFNIVLQSLSGQVFELHWVRAEDVLTLKRIAAKHCELPAQCISLAEGGKVLQDHEYLHLVFKDLPEPFTLTLYVSAKPLYSNLHLDEQTQLKTLRDFQFLGKRGDDRAVAAVIACVRDLYQGPLLLCALETLGIIAEQGDRSAIEFAEAHLHGEKDDVKLQALACLQQISNHGDPYVIAMVLEFLQTNWNIIRCEPKLWRAGLACLCALTTIPSIISGVVVRLKTANSGIRHSVMQALTRATEKLDESILEQVATCLEDQDSDVRCAALEALLQFTQPGASPCPEPIVTSVAAFLNVGDSAELLPDTHRVEKQQALRVLSQCRFVEAWEAVAKVMLDADEDVRRAAYVAMMNLMRSWDHAPDKIFDAMEPLLNDLELDVVCQPGIEIICAAVHSLALSSTAAVSAAKLALSAIGASSGIVQLHAIKTLNGLAKFREDLSTEQVLCAVRPFSKSNDMELRAQAYQALLNFVQSGNADIVMEISVALRTCKSQDGTRQIAQVLSQFSDSGGTPVAVTAFATLLEQSCEDSCKLVALGGLKAVSSTWNMPHSAHATTSSSYCTARRVVLDHIQHPNPEVAVAAVTVLEQLCLQGDPDAVPILTTLALDTQQREMLLALASLSQIGDESVLQSLFVRSRSGHWPMREAALRGLTKVAVRGCPHTCEFLQNCISNDRSDVVRSTAVEVLASLSEPGDTQIAGFLEGEREEQPFEVQMAIDDALESLTWVEVLA